ncbi:hypothetical protein K402DRAFT_391147 [Aulographum hederae CBS 113979]|uniref:Peroxisomal membrane protein PEX14 n=1 Tax=Aulographum hederae CBS 113979 TaxID=1176131 RepID=A0A6G1H7I1_9PEZI|nr:hypothetical protein K402DRAFT_391147 [Aulographum hederae CBS 113979]
MSDPKKASIPAWQQARPPPSPDSEASSTTPATPKEEPREEEAQQEISGGTKSEQSMSLQEQGRRFLEDATVKDAPRAKKIEFLQSKGLPKEEIEKLLGPISSQTPPSVPDRAWAFPSGESVAPSPSQSQQKREVPPIITYPEFLVHSNKPEPLVTTTRLLNTLYVAGGSAALLYGLSKYIVAPLSETLAAARHDLLSHTSTQLDGLNERLTGMVSTVPSIPSPESAGLGTARKESDDTDTESEASDPTELYHRDVGVQTTPNLSRRNSQTSDSTLSVTPVDTVTAQEHRFKAINGHLTDLVASSARTKDFTGDLTYQLTELTAYLNEMSYTSPYYGTGYGGLDGRGVGGGGGSGPGSWGKKDDAYEKFKAEIRGVKGVLLSARNFPAGGGHRPGGSR